MSQNALAESTNVGQKDRISVDVSDIKKDIETCRTDAAWVELAMTAKIRVLIKERLDQILSEKESRSQSTQQDK
ncbi:MAG: hypothetical protein ACKO24_01890 [Leptolyngbyaceae cyanobacterium]